MDAMGDVRLVPKADIRTAAKAPLFNHLVGAQKERLWHRQAERLATDAATRVSPRRLQRHSFCDDYHSANVRMSLFWHGGSERMS
jgi:hypothetical protein